MLDEAVHNLECLCPCGASFVKREPVQSLQDSLDVVLSQKFLHEFLYVPVSKRATLGRMRLTQSPLLDLPRCHSKSGENLHQYFYDDVGNGWRKRDPCVDIKPAQESLDRLEQVYESIIARIDIFYRLIRSKRHKECRDKNCKKDHSPRVRWRMRQILPLQVGTAMEYTSET